MHISIDDLSWHWFKGNEVSGRLLQDVCLFRSCVLFDSGFRKNFGSLGRNFGDIQFSDFESYHIVACFKQEILGTIRLTPPLIETVALSVLGLTDYKNLIKKLNSDLNSVIEMNRLMIDYRVRRLSLGQNLIFAAIGLIENIYERNKFTIIGSAGNCTKQVDFCLNYTDYEKIPGVSDKFASAFNDSISFLKYRNPPYIRGSDKIEFFRNIFKHQTKVPWDKFKINYQITPLNKLEANELT